MGLAEHDLTIALDDAVADVGQCPATDADGVHLGHLVSDGTKLRHRPERLALEIQVQSRHNDSDAAAGQVVADIHYLLVEELRFVYSQNVGIGSHEQYTGCALHRGGGDGVSLVADHVFFTVSHINGGFEDFHFLVLPENMEPQMTSTRPLRMSSPL